MLIGMTIPLTGTQHEIEAGDYQATVTELGAGLRGLKFGDTFLVTSFEADVLPPPIQCYAETKNHVFLLFADSRGNSPNQPTLKVVRHDDQRLVVILCGLAEGPDT